MLPAVMFVTMMLAGLGVILLFTTGNERMAGRAVRESAKAFYAAEAGANAVIAGWDQKNYDNLLTGAGDSVDLGWQPLDNGCSYRAVVHRVDNASSFNKSYTTIVEGRGSGGLRGQRSLAVQLRTEMLGHGIAVVVGGPLELTGNMSILGDCPGLHANGPIWGGGTVVISGIVSSADSILMAADKIVDTLGIPIQTLSYVDSVDIPQLYPMDYCDEAEYFVRNGWIVTVGPPTDSLLLPSDTVGDVLGWSRGNGVADYTAEFNGIQPGTVCVEGDVTASGSSGTETDPLVFSVFATGSIKVTGQSFLLSDHSNEIALLAGGDLLVEGKTDIDTGIDGIVYARSHCDFGGSTNITGQIVCLSEPDPPGAKNLQDASSIRGGTGLEFGCGRLPIGARAMPLRQGAWSQVF